jgi:hypothetical protein
MPAERIDEVLLRNYLLGKLSEEEQVQVEDRAFSDPEYLVAVEGAEADLIDSYVRGDLQSTDRRIFEGRFLTSPQRRRKVEFAKTLEQVTAELKTSRPLVPERPPFWQTLVDLVRGFHPAVSFAGALAVLALIAGTAWLLVHDSDMRSRVAALEARRSDLENREQTLRQQLMEQQARTTDGQPAPSQSRHSTVIASLVFLPGMSRAATRVQQLTLTPGAQLAHIEIQLEARDEFPQFRAELRTRSGDEILVRSGLVRRQSNGAYSVSLDVPCSAVPTGEYELTLKGLSDGQTTDIGYYYFRVQVQ